MLFGRQALHSFEPRPCRAGANQTGREALRQTESQVLTNAITAYVDVRRDRKILQILKDEIVDLTRDYHETEARQSAGQLSRVDLAEAQERLLLAQSQFELAQGHLDASAAEYLDVIGESQGELEAEPDLAVGRPGGP